MKKIKSIPVTIQTDESRRDRMERLAFEVGQQRIKNGVMVGNVSWSINEAIDFLLSHRDLYLSWHAERLAAALKND